MEENFEVATTHNILVFPEICQKFEYIIIYRFLEVSQIVSKFGCVFKVRKFTSCTRNTPRIMVHKFYTDESKV